MIARCLFAAAACTSVAFGYIHIPPATLHALCKDSTAIRLLTVKSMDRSTGKIEFEVSESLKGGNGTIASFEHTIDPTAKDSERIFDALEKGKSAVLFTSETAMGSCGFAFVDEYCYSVDYSATRNTWVFLRGEPGRSMCYHGSADRLANLSKDLLAGKTAVVPYQQPSVDDRDGRYEQIVETLKKNRSK